MSLGPAELARRLAERAEDVCQHYLSNGHPAGRYWLVGDVHNAAGRSLFVRLEGPLSGKRAAGKWTDAATGEHGDLLDLIQLAGGHPTLGTAMAEARSFLALPAPSRRSDTTIRSSQPCGSTHAAAQRLFSSARPIGDTPAASYLQARAITVSDLATLRYHPSVYYCERRGASRQVLPAMLAAITDVAGHLVGVNRTWLDTKRRRVARIKAPKRVLGELLGHGVRFGRADQSLLAGEGIETVLSLKSVLPGLPMVAALTATHLAGINLPVGVERLFIARDNDEAGMRAADRLRQRAETAGLSVVDVVPEHGDFNDDLRDRGRTALLESLCRQLGSTVIEANATRPS